MITTIDKNTALILIDLQKGIVKAELAHPVQQVIENASKLITAFRKAGLPVVIVNVKPSGNLLQARKDMQRNAGAMPGDFAEIVEELKTQPDDLFITKHTWNAFYDTALQTALQKRKITGIVIGGVSTSIGVEGTMRAALELGYNISVATDATTDTNKNAYENSIKNIFPGMAELGTTAEIVAKLRK